MPHLFKKLKKLSILLFSPLFLSGASLDTLIQNALNSHSSLEVITHKLSTISEEKELAYNFENPELSLSISDIQLGDISNRSIEPMQFTSINFKQKIPYFGKRDALAKKIDAKKELIALDLSDAKVKLTQLIKITAYSIWQVEKQLGITQEYIKLTQQNIELFSAYNTTDTSAHMGIMNAELSLSQQQIKKSNLLSLKEGLYKELGYLCNAEVTSIGLDTEVQKPKSVESFIKLLEQNTRYRYNEAKSKELQADVEYKELQKYSDPVVQVGYYHRQSFEDYINVGIALSLPLYGSENAQEQIARKLLLSQKSEQTDFKELLTSKIHKLYTQLQDSYRVYNIIQKESLPQVAHMFELSGSAISSGADLFLYTSMLEKKLKLEAQSINAQANYFKTLASLDALTGATQ